MRSLLYLASGNGIKKEYFSLHFNLICLVDYFFPKPIKKKGKFLLLGMDVIDAIKYLRGENLKFDCLVILNEGLYEGGGKYSLHADLVLGYLMPILKDTYIHIMNPSYYLPSSRINTSLDLPYEKKEIFSDDENYLNPKIFSTLEDSKVFLMKKISHRIELKLENGKKVNFIWDSIWNYKDKFENIVTFFRGRTISRILIHEPKIRNYDVEGIMKIEIAKEEVKNCHGKKIAFTSFYPGKIDKFLDFLRNHDGAYPEEIFIFYLNKKDQELFLKLGRE